MSAKPVTDAECPECGAQVARFVVRSTGAEFAFISSLFHNLHHMECPNHHQYVYDSSRGTSWLMDVDEE